MSDDERLDNEFDEEVKTEITNAIKAGGVASLGRYLMDNQNKWQTIPINVGIIGNSGTGKSSIINALRGLKARDPGAAAVGSKQTTMEPTAYKYPDNENMKLWDLPGVGTPDFPRETYFEKIGFEKFDSFIILATLRFREEDVSIADELKRLGKQFFYVRTMLDNDVRNNERDKGFTKSETIAEVRADVEGNIKKHALTPTGVYLISNYDWADYDFPKLTTDLVTKFPCLKRDSLVLTMKAYSAEMLDLKVEVLRKKIKWIALLGVPSIWPWDATWLLVATARLAATSIRSLPDLPSIAAELEFYYRQLGLTDEALRQLGLLKGVDLRCLVAIVAEKYPVSSFSLDSIRITLTEFGEAQAKPKGLHEEVASYIPILGTLVSFGKSAEAVWWVLNTSLTKMHDAAREVLKEAISKHVVYATKRGTIE